MSLIVTVASWIMIGFAIERSLQLYDRHNETAGVVVLWPVVVLIVVLLATDRAVLRLGHALMRLSSRLPRAVARFRMGVYK